MEYIIDIQGFKRSFNRFVFKEVAILAAEEDAMPTVYHFKSPFNWDYLSSEHKNSNSWLKRNLHGLNWDSGSIPYNRLEGALEIALDNASKIYVKGLEKKIWLKEVLPTKNIQNIEDIGCPALHKLHKDGKKLCSMHLFGCLRNPMCAAQNADAVKTWLMEYRLKNASRDTTWTGANLNWEREGIDEVDKEILYSMYN